MNEKLITALLSLFLVFILILSACAQPVAPSPTPAPAEMPAEVPETPAEEPAVIREENLDQLIIGDSTEPTGDFATPYWQNNATDHLVNQMLSGYATYDLTPTGELVVNKTAVEEPVITENEDGSKTYEFTVKDGLTYNDGSAITAKDYVASVLLWSSRQVRDFDGKPTAGYHLKGFGPFFDGESNVFAGVHLLDEMRFSLTIADEYIPFFYEVADVSFGPTPLDFWLGEGVADVADDGEGAYFTGDFADIIKPGVNDDPNDERFARFFEIKDYMLAQRNVIPRVTSGPYEVVSFNQSTKVVTITLNDKFLGNFEGQKGSIKDLVFKKTDQNTQFDELRTGTIDLLSRMASGAEINAGYDLVDEDPDKYDLISFPRAGYGNLTFICDFGPTQFVEVRQGIAHLIDRNDFATTFTGGYGSVVNGPYGEGQWFYKESKAELDSKLNSYDYSLDSAIALFEQAGFTKNEDGSEYSGTGLRYREMEDGSMMPLLLNWFGSEDNPFTELLIVKLKESQDVAAAGMKIDETIGDFNVLLNWMYRDTSEGEEYGVPTYHVFNLANDFGLNYFPTTEWSTDHDLLDRGGLNINRLFDEELYRLSTEYYLVEPTDKEGFREGWVNYVVRWNELLPMIPLYSQEYHSFFNSKLKNFVLDDNFGLSIALLYATLE